ncbi:MAG: aldehyde dehydrogenase family protein [Burkholderiaceae bacterium]
MKHFAENYIDGQWLASTGDEYIDVADPNTGLVRARVCSGHENDALKAIEAAAAAFPAWSNTALRERTEAVRRLAGCLEAIADDMAHCIAGEVGTPLKIARIVQTLAPIRNCSNFIEIAEKFQWSKKIKHSTVLREPVGVVACITPWNFPLHQIILKIVPAVLCGNTVVLKPSELTPATTRLFAEALHESGFPPGVLNIVNGLGRNVGMPLSQSPAVHMVSFTGSTRTGQAIMSAASSTVKKISLELGGKSPSVILPSADIARAVKATVGGCLLNNGQTCNALTRMLVPANRLDEVEELLKTEFAKLTVGSSLDASHRIGPLISAAQQQRVRGLVQSGLEQGAVVLASNDAIPNDGFFIAPMALGVRPDNVLAREEVFGPVLSVIAYSSVQEAIALANDTEYGLAAAVWGEQREAMDAARRIRAGQVDINGAPFNPYAPFGGYGQSGIGREGGEAGFEEFLEYKAIQLPLEAAELE